MVGFKKRLVVAVAVVLMGSGMARATPHLVTGSGDSEYNHVYQGASAATLAGLGYTIGTGATDLKVYTNGTWVDPSGIVFGTLVPGLENITGPGKTTDKITFAYDTANPAVYKANASPSPDYGNANARDYYWIQNMDSTNGGNGNTTRGNTAGDTPWLGSIFDLGGQANQAVVFPIIDHGPLPGEAGEFTIYLTNKPTSTNLADWNLATLDSIYLEGWESDITALADGFTTVWKLPGNQTFQYVSVRAIGSQAIPGYVGNENEIDAVAGLTAQGQSVVPLPSAALAGAAGLLGLIIARFRKSSPI